jgi:hypothetical protein
MDTEGNRQRTKRSEIRKKLPMKILLPILAISMISVASFAATVSVTQTTLQAQTGVYYDVTEGFTAVSNGFTVVQSTGAASAQPYTWSNGGTCQTALTAGNWMYTVTLTITASAATSHTYTYTVSWNTGSGYTQLGQLTFTTLGTITPGQTVTFLIDLGGTSFSAPAGINITVA